MDLALNNQKMVDMPWNQTKPNQTKLFCYKGGLWDEITHESCHAIKQRSQTRLLNKFTLIVPSPIRILSIFLPTILVLWKHPQIRPQGQRMLEYEQQQYVFKLWLDLQSQLLWASQPVPNRPY